MAAREPEVGRMTGSAHEDLLLARERHNVAAQGRRDALRLHAAQLALLALLLAGWWAASGTLIDRLFISDPLSVLIALGRIMFDGTLWWHLWQTLVEMTLGFIVGVAGGVALAIVVALIPRGETVARPLMMGIFAIPKVALAPLVIVWFGIYLLPKIVLAASLVFFIVYFNTLAGFAAVSPGTLAAVRVMGASRAAIFRKLVLPSAAPYIFTAMRITLPGALIGAIIGEFISSNRGVGFLIAAASSRYDTALVFASILSLLVFVLILNALVSRVERYALRWQPRESASRGLA
jgi:NitT/TauT family transport system permease protein